ncbi:MAG: hypothetical protein IJP80_05990 [Bacteroidales bacterium]|nr:hypothetical protein [Bacteroidales bacterium]
MKKTVLLSLLAAALLTACNNDEKEIRNTAYGYIIATGNYQIDEAKQYASEKTRDTTLPFIKDRILPLTDTSYILANTPATATIDSIVVLNDTAWVLYTKTTPLTTSTNELCLIKEKGRWVVDVPLILPEKFTFTPATTDSTSIATERYR